MTTIARPAWVPITTPTAAETTTTGSGEAVSTMPQPPMDPLTAMTCSSDFGSAVAALVFNAEKHNRDAAKSARDASYKSMEAEEGKELAHMDQAASRRFLTGMTEGSLQLGSAGCSFGGSFTAPNSGASARWGAAGQAAKAGDTFAGAFGKAGSDAADRRVKADEQNADECKRVAENHNDDVQDASKGMDKAVEFYQQWISARNAEQQAALHRS